MKIKRSNRKLWKKITDNQDNLQIKWQFLHKIQVLFRPKTPLLFSNSNSYNNYNSKVLCQSTRSSHSSSLIHRRCWVCRRLLGFLQLLHKCNLYNNNNYWCNCQNIRKSWTYSLNNNKFNSNNSRLLRLNNSDQQTALNYRVILLRDRLILLYHFRVIKLHNSYLEINNSNRSQETLILNWCNKMYISRTSNNLT